MPSAATGSTGWRRRPGAALPAAVARRPADRHLAAAHPLLVGAAARRRGRPGGPRGRSTLWIAAGCALGAVLMRGAGCTWNDLTDRDIDARVARTRSRPLPSGQVTPRQAAAWMVAQALAACADPAQLPAAGGGARHRPRWRWSRSIPSPSASPGGRRSSSGSPSTGGRCSAGRRTPAALGRGAAAALRGGDRLDAVLRHDLRAPGPRGRRADRGEVDGAAVRDARPRRWLAGLPRRRGGARGAGGARRRRSAGAALVAGARSASPASRCTSAGSSAGSTSTTPRVCLDALPRQPRRRADPGRGAPRRRDSVTRRSA